MSLEIKARDHMKAKTTWLIVLGDFGRSPRMQYHAVSLSKQVSQVRVCERFSNDPSQLLAISQAGNHVCVLAQHQSTPLNDVATDPHISLWNLPQT